MAFGDMFQYLKYLITGDTEAMMKMNQLKSIYKSFKPSRYRYVTKEKIITQLFVNKIHTLFQHISKFKNLLESTLFTSDEAKANLYLNYYIESFLPDELKNKREKFLKEMMLQKVMEADNANKMIKKLENEFNVFKQYFNRSRMPRIEAEYLLLYRLNSLATFNFDLFFSKFDPEFDINSKKPPAYNPVHGKDLVGEFKDLYFLIGSLPKKVPLDDSFNRLYQKIFNSNDKKLVKETQAAVDAIFKMISQELAPIFLLNMAKYVSEDPGLKIRIEVKNFSILERYRKELDDRFNRNKAYVLEQFSDLSLQNEINALFKNKSLLQIEGYNDELLEALHSKNIAPINGMQGLKITKTFIFEIYEKKIKEAINVLILEAFFAEKDYQQEVSEAFFKANEMMNYYLECERAICNSPGNSIKSLAASLNTNNTNKTQMIVNIINDKVQECNRRCTENYYRLGTRLFEILSDFKKQKPEKVTNIKQIKGGQNKEFVNQLVNSYSDLSKYLKLLKNFVKSDMPARK
ncbi:MAG: DUF5312 family protein [Spirochaetes bacterium]|nr:DUF5312 family protein [Spirochaetota bacterium]